MRKPIDEREIFNVARRIQDSEEQQQFLDKVCGDNPEARQRIVTLLQGFNAAEDFLEPEIAVIERIFEQALAIDDAEQLSGFLAEACQDDAIRQKVEALLAAQPELGSFLTQDRVQNSQLTAVGNQIGPYKLREQIGEGGMGVVYVAEQEQPVRRKVALKVIKPGMDSKEVLGRFESERQALAVMEHPNIARILDAGITEIGRSYFAMELVRGIPITDYCDEARLTQHERLALFSDVCQAVHHAHQKGVIHRDIKPSNVLVTQIDGKPVVKVIDFGLAKATGPKQLTDKSVYTHFLKFMGTPAYMSPEQAGLSGVDIDTRSDIYSLGIVLYELLTGTTPLSKEDCSKGSYEELRKRICEVDAPKPSHRISTLDNEARTTIAENRGVTTDRLSQLVSGELDWIVLKALDKERARRYSSAVALSDDVRRYLNDEPVNAVAPSLGYVLSKTLKRNKAAVTTVAGFLSLLLLGAIVSTVLAIRTNQALAQVTAEKKKADAATNEAKRDRDRAHAAKEIANQEREVALEERKKAQIERQKALDLAYNNDVRNAYLNARHADGSDRVAFDLLKWVPLDGQKDRRGWEWYLLNSIPTGAEQLLHGHTTPVFDIASSPDGNFLVSRDADGMLIVWDVRSGKKLETKQFEGLSVVWSPKGDQLALAGSKGEIQLWEINTSSDGSSDSRTWQGFGKSVQLERHTNAVNALAYSPDGKFLASAGGDGLAIIWDTDSGGVVAVFEEHDAPVRCVSWHPDGNQVLSTQNIPKGGGVAIRFWNPLTGQQTSQPVWSDVNLRWAMWRDDGELLATTKGAAGRIAIYDGVSHEVVRELTTQNPTYAIWSPKGRYLATSHPWGGETSVLKIWDADAEYPLRAFDGHTYGFNKPIWIDENRVATSSSDHTIRVWNVQSGTSKTLSLEPTLQPIHQALWSPDGRFLATLTTSGSVSLLSAKDGRLVKRISADTPVKAIAWSPDSRRLATWDLATISIRDTSSSPTNGNGIRGKEVFSFPTGQHEMALANNRSLVWQPQGDRIIAAVSGKVGVWNSKTGKQEKEITEHVHGLVASSPAGDRIVTSSSVTVDSMVFDLREQNPQRKDVRFGGVVAWSPDGTLLATAEGNGVIRRADTFDVVLRMDGIAHSHISAIDWHPDGSRIVTASETGTVRLWDAQSGRELIVFRDLVEPVRWVEFSADGTRLLAAGDDGKVKVWDATSGYVNSSSADFLNLLNERMSGRTATADDFLSRARIHTANGNWDDAATDFQEATALLGDQAPQWFEAGEWVIGPYPGNLQHSYPPELTPDFHPMKSLEGVTADSAAPEAKDLSWQIAKPGLAQGANLSLHVGTAENISAHAISKIYAPRAAYVSALIGAARFDEHRLWHNGKLIYEDLQSNVQGRWPDEGNIAVKLEPGWNTFLVKIVNIPFREKNFYTYFRLSNDPVFLAGAYERMEDATEAVKALDRFLIQNPHDEYLKISRAIAYMRLGNSDLAREDLQFATARLGQKRVAQVFRGTSASRSVAVLSQALKATPDNQELRELRADLLSNEGSWKEALEDERELAKWEPFERRVENRALLLAAANDTEEYELARDLILERIEKGERDSKLGVAIEHQIIACLMLPGSPEKIRRIAKAYKWYSVLPVPGLADPHGRAQKRLEGILAYRQNAFDRAIELLSEAEKFQLNLDEPWMVEHARRRASGAAAFLAMSLHRKGRTEEARVKLKLARGLYEQYGNPDIYSELAIREATQLIRALMFSALLVLWKESDAASRQRTVKV